MLDWLASVILVARNEVAKRISGRVWMAAWFRSPTIDRNCSVSSGVCVKSISICLRFGCIFNGLKGNLLV